MPDGVSAECWHLYNACSSTLLQLVDEVTRLRFDGSSLPMQIRFLAELPSTTAKGLASIDTIDIVSSYSHRTNTCQGGHIMSLVFG